MVQIELGYWTFKRGRSIEKRAPVAEFRNEQDGTYPVLLSGREIGQIGIGLDWMKVLMDYNLLSS